MWRPPRNLPGEPSLGLLSSLLHATLEPTLALCQHVPHVEGLSHGSMAGAKPLAQGEQEPRRQSHHSLSSAQPGTWQATNAQLESGSLVN